jgi:hypothetical protein
MFYFYFFVSHLVVFFRLKEINIDIDKSIFYSNFCNNDNEIFSPTYRKNLTFNKNPAIVFFSLVDDPDPTPPPPSPPSELFINAIFIRNCSFFS